MHSEPIAFHRSRADLAWREWSPTAFASARAQRRPVLLMLTMPWSDACAATEAELSAEGPLAQLVSRAFIPVRVDAERRPDISERYEAGGWPTIAVLSPAGATLAAAAAPRPLPEVLTRIADAYARQGDDLADSTPSAPPALVPARAPDRGAALHFAELALVEEDPVHGGLGRGAKFAHADALRALLAAGCHELVRRALDALAALHDADEGGVFRHAAADWSAPAREKLLEDQASVLDLYVDAARVLDASAYRERAMGLVRFVTTHLADPAGGFGGSIRDGRLDRTCYIDANARVTSALLKCAVLTSDETLARDAVARLERVLLSAYRPSHGVAHWIAEGRAGDERFLRDQVAVAEAMLAAHAVGGDDTHLMMAEELMLGAVRQLWDAAVGAFRDRASRADEGPLAVPLFPLEANCRAALVLAALADRSGKHEHMSRAEDILRAFASNWRSQGLLGAPYVSAVLAIG